MLSTQTQTDTKMLNAQTQPQTQNTDTNTRILAPILLGLLMNSNPKGLYQSDAVCCLNLMQRYTHEYLGPTSIYTIMFQLLLPDYLGESIPLGVLLALDFGSLGVWTSNLTVSMQQKRQLSLVIVAGMIL